MQAPLGPLSPSLSFPVSSLLPQSFPRRADLWWLILACGVGGWLVIRSCWWEWSYNPQYSYGTLVPLLVLLLLARRWPDRPEQQAPSRSGKVVAVLALGGSAVLLALIQPLAASAADWRMVPGLAATSGIALALSGTYLIGGRSWLRHFAFPLLFFWVAVPWPSSQENVLMSWLMNHNTAFCVEVLHWLGYAAEQRGNLIAIPGALLGVEEACSGIRSLQSGIMVALAMGEFFRVRLGARSVLFLVALGGALLGNALRSLILSLAACQNGTDAVDKIHDAAGLSVLLGTSALVLVTGKLLSRHSAEALSQAERPPKGIGLPQGLRLAAISLVILWLGSVVGSEGWFRWHEARALASAPQWTVREPQPTENIQTEPISERTLGLLLYPRTARSESWRDGKGWQWQSFYFYWPPGPNAANSAMGVHNPSNCLQGIGFELVDKLPDWSTEVAGSGLTFQRYLFYDRGHPVQVFHTVVEDDGRPSTSYEEASLSRTKRWENVRMARRNRGLRVLEFAVKGAPDAAEAEAAAQEWLSRRIEMQTGDE